MLVKIHLSSMRQNSKGLNKSNYFGAILQSSVKFKLSKTRTDPGSGAAIYAYWIETRYKKHLDPTRFATEVCATFLRVRKVSAYFFS